MIVYRKSKRKTVREALLALQKKRTIRFALENNFFYQKLKRKIKDTLKIWIPQNVIAILAAITNKSSYYISLCIKKEIIISKIKNNEILYLFFYPANITISMYQRPHHFIDEILCLDKVSIIYMYGAFASVGYIKLDENAFLASYMKYNIVDSGFVVKTLKSEINEIVKNFNKVVCVIDHQSCYQGALDIEHDNKKIVYHCMDDYSEFNDIVTIKNKKEIKRSMEKAYEACDIYVSTAKNLLHYFNYLNLLKKAALIRNGCEFEHFNQEIPNKLLSLDKPVIGYFGAIANWFDWDAVIALAEQRKDYNIVIIGLCIDIDKRAYDYRNIHLLGKKDYADLPLYAYHFDVQIIPFKIIPLIDNTDPCKFYEYCCNGKPIVGSDMKELRYCQDLFYVYKSPQDFIAKVDLALNEKNESLKQKRIKFGKDNSWRARVEEFHKFIMADYGQ